MDAQFWQQRWATNKIHFHEKAVNPLLIAHFGSLAIPAGSRVFVPLCGKTLDIGWLLSQGYHVAGAELSELAIEQLFAELGVRPDITAFGTLKRYSAANIDIFVGDVFDLTAAQLGSVAAIFDRAALVALPDMLRERYSRHISAITDTAPLLLVTYEYDQTVMDGPPFSVPAAEIQRHYQAVYDISLLARNTLAGGMKQADTAQELVWLLQPKTPPHTP